MAVCWTKDRRVLGSKSVSGDGRGHLYGGGHPNRCEAQLRRICLAQDIGVIRVRKRERLGVFGRLDPVLLGLV